MHRGALKKLVLEFGLLGVGGGCDLTTKLYEVTLETLNKAKKEANRPKFYILRSLQLCFIPGQLCILTRPHSIGKWSHGVKNSHSRHLDTITEC